MDNDLNANYKEGNRDPNKSVMTITDWLITFVIMMVPCVNIVMFFIWAFGDGNENRKNYCRAALIMCAIVIGLVMVLGVLGTIFTMSANF